MTWRARTPRYQGDMDFPEKGIELKAIRTDSFCMVVEAIREGITDGTVKDDFDPVKFTILMGSSIQSILNTSPAVETHMKSYELKLG